MRLVSGPVDLDKRVWAAGFCENNALPSGYPVGTPEEALDYACGLYLHDPTA